MVCPGIYRCCLPTCLGVAWWLGRLSSHLSPHLSCLPSCFLVDPDTYQGRALFASLALTCVVFLVFHDMDNDDMELYARCMPHFLSCWTSGLFGKITIVKNNNTRVNLDSFFWPSTQEVICFSDVSHPWRLRSFRLDECCLCWNESCSSPPRWLRARCAPRLCASAPEPRVACKMGNRSPKRRDTSNRESVLPAFGFAHMVLGRYDNHDVVDPLIFTDPSDLEPWQGQPLQPAKNMPLPWLPTLWLYWIDPLQSFYPEAPDVFKPSNSQVLRPRNTSRIFNGGVGSSIESPRSLWVRGKFMEVIGGCLHNSRLSAP